MTKILVFSKLESFMRFRSQLVFHVHMQLQAPMQSILVSIFRIGLLRLSAGTYEATSSTIVNLVSHLEWF